jgi:hypothetical protein
MRYSLFFLVSLALAAGGGSDQPVESVELARFPLDDLTGVIDAPLVEVEPGITSDGNGSLRVVAARATRVRLFETGDLDIEDARLVYAASLRGEGIEGAAYLEMWCVFPSGREYFSRSVHEPLSGDAEWTFTETPFLLQPGQNPTNVKLNVVLDGTGTIWIDDIRLIKRPLG